MERTVRTAFTESFVMNKVTAPTKWQLIGRAISHVIIVTLNVRKKTNVFPSDPTLGIRNKQIDLLQTQGHSKFPRSQFKLILCQHHLRTFTAPADAKKFTK